MKRIEIDSNNVTGSFLSACSKAKEGLTLYCVSGVSEPLTERKIVGWQTSEIAANKFCAVLSSSDAIWLRGQKRLHKLLIPVICHAMSVARGIELVRNTPFIPAIASVVKQLTPPPMPSVSEVFTKIYETGGWGKKWDSGAGSDLSFASPYIGYVSRFIKDAKASAVLDAGTGDGRVLDSIIKQVKRKKTKFLATDCSEAIVAMGKKACPGAEWSVLDLAKDEIPKADIVLLKDVLNHLPNNLIESVLDRLVASGAKAIIASCDFRNAEVSKDIQTGDHRALDLNHPLFSRFRFIRVLEYGDKAIWLCDTANAGDVNYNHKVFTQASTWCQKLWLSHIRYGAEPNGIWPEETMHTENVRRSFIIALKEEITRKVPTDTSCKGDGLVIIGAGRWWLMSCMSAHMARKNGWDGPIQIWHREQEMVGDLSWMPEGCEVVNANAYAKKHNIKLRLNFTDRQGWDHPYMKGGWVVKSFALRHCPFARVLYLDSDAYPIANPKLAFDAMDGKAFGYWRDTNQHGGLKWHVYPDARPLEHTGPIQGGVTLFDKSGAEGQHLLRVYDWIQQRADYFYRFGYGDQDCLWLAVSACKTPAKEVGKLLAASDPVHIVKVSDRHQVFVHRIGLKVWPDLPPTIVKNWVPQEKEYQDLRKALLS